MKICKIMVKMRLYMGIKMDNCSNIGFYTFQYKIIAEKTKSKKRSKSNEHSKSGASEPTV